MGQDILISPGGDKEGAGVEAVNSALLARRPTCPPSPDGTPPDCYVRVVYDRFFPPTPQPKYSPPLRITGPRTVKPEVVRRDVNHGLSDT